MICWIINFKNGQELKFLNNLMSLFGYFLHLTAHLFYLSVHVTHLLQRRLLYHEQNRLIRVTKTYFSQILIIKLFSYCPLKTQGNITSKAFCWPHCWSSSSLWMVHKVLKDIVVLPGTSVELNVVLLQYRIVALKRPEVMYPKQMKFFGISDTWGIFNYLFVRFLFEVSVF